MRYTRHTNLCEWQSDWKSHVVGRRNEINWFLTNVLINLMDVWLLVLPRFHSSFFVAIIHGPISYRYISRLNFLKTVILSGEYVKLSFSLTLSLTSFFPFFLPTPRKTFFHFPPKFFFPPTTFSFLTRQTSPADFNRYISNPLCGIKPYPPWMEDYF